MFHQTAPVHAAVQPVYDPVGRLGDARARELLREHERITREALKAHSGSEVTTMGDGVMAAVGAATKALEFALAIQPAFAYRSEQADELANGPIDLPAGGHIADT